LLCKAEDEVGVGTSVKEHFIYAARKVIADSSGFGGYVLNRTGSVRELGGTLHIDHEFASRGTVGMYGSYSELAQSLTTTARGNPPQMQPGDSSLGEFGVSANADLLISRKRPVKIAGGAGGRKENLRVPTSPYDTSYTTLGRKIGDIYLEALVPVFDAPHAVLDRLDVSLAGREDYYQVAGPTFNPKAGLLWSPYRNLNLRTNYARSFRPPPLDKLPRIPVFYTVNIPDQAGGTTDILVNQSQGIYRLKPEIARTITAGLDWRRDLAGGVSASLTWYHTVMDNRIAAPSAISPGVMAAIFSQPELIPYIQNSPDLAQTQAIFAGPGFIQDFAKGGPGAVRAEFDNEVTNIARTLEEGLETSGYYTIGERPRQFGASVIANYLLRDTYRAVPGGPTQPLVNNVGQPVNLRARGGMSQSWDGWCAAVNVNYTNRYRNVLVAPAQNVASFTTVDFQVAYQIPFSSSPGRDIQFTFNMQNVRNAAPPRVTVPPGLGFRPVGFDPANASPYGRVISLDVSVGW
jgi:outer membrane receptor protein involved in Fe transport